MCMSERDLDERWWPGGESELLVEQDAVRGCEHPVGGDQRATAGGHATKLEVCRPRPVGGARRRAADYSRPGRRARATPRGQRDRKRDHDSEQCEEPEPAGRLWHAAPKWVEAQALTPKKG